MNRRKFLTLLSLSAGIYSIDQVTGANLALAQNSTASPIDNKTRWKNLTPEQRQELRERWQKFKGMSPEEQAKLKQAWQSFKVMPPEKQQRIRENFKHWNSLPDGQKQKIRER